MDAFVWSDRFVTGLDSVDREHRSLVDLINRVGRLAERERDADPATLKQIFDELFAYARYHFSNEERLMDEARCHETHVSYHRREHSRFLQQVHFFNQATGDDEVTRASTLVKFLASWLAYHVLGADQSMALQIAAIRAGNSPEEAAAASVVSVDDASATLLGALDSVMRVVAQRNVELARADKQLRAANVELEARVEARTRELAEAHERLLQSERLASIGQLAAGVAHEINNPIAFVTANLSTLDGYVHDLLELVARYERAEGELPEATRSELAESKDALELDFLRGDATGLLDESLDGLHRVARIVEDLKTFSRGSDGSSDSVDLVEGLETTIRLIWSELQRAEIVREYQKLPSVQCVPAQVNYIFASLLVNAAKGIKGRGRMILRTGSERDEVWIEVESDSHVTGPEEKDRVHQSFFNTDALGDGRGLGLAVADGMIRAHHGRLDVERREGEGTRLRLWLPMREAS